MYRVRHDGVEELVDPASLDPKHPGRLTVKLKGERSRLAAQVGVITMNEHHYHAWTF